MLLNKKWKCPIFFFSFLCVVTVYYNLYSLLESSLLDDVNQLTFKMENCPCTRYILGKFIKFLKQILRLNTITRF